MQFNKELRVNISTNNKILTNKINPKQINNINNINININNINSGVNSKSNSNNVSLIKDKGESKDQKVMSLKNKTLHSNINSNIHQNVKNVNHHPVNYLQKENIKNTLNTSNTSIISTVRESNYYKAQAESLINYIKSSKNIYKLNIY